MPLTHPTWVIDTTFSGKNIVTAASVYTFTAAAAAKVQFTVKLTNAAGNGDYIVYLQHQWLGTGTASVVLPKATCAAASGETVIEFVSMELSVKATDVVDVYIDGLAGDTSVNGAIRISADNPSVFDAANDVPAANVTYHGGVAVAAADVNGNVPVVLYETQGAVTFGQIYINPTSGAGVIIAGGPSGELPQETGVMIRDQNAVWVRVAEELHSIMTSGEVTTAVEASNIYAIVQGFGNGVGRTAYFPITEYTGTPWPAGNELEFSTEYADDTFNGWTLVFFHSDGSIVGTAVIVDTVLDDPNNLTVVTLDRNMTTIERQRNYMIWPTSPFEGGTIDQQDIANAGLLAPVGAAAAGSQMALTAAILEDTGTTLPTLITAISQTVNSSTDSTTAGAITRRRGDSWSIPMTLGAVTGYTSLWFTIKKGYDDLDSAALLHVKLNASTLLDGLLYVNGAAATSEALASITVSNAGTGAIIVAVDETVTDDLAPGSYYYDAQALIAGAVTTPDSGVFTITSDVTRSVT